MTAVDALVGEVRAACIGVGTCALVIGVTMIARALRDEHRAPNGEKRDEMIVRNEPVILRHAVVIGFAVAFLVGALVR